jgi:hypothetical protein
MWQRVLITQKSVGKSSFLLNLWHEARSRDNCQTLQFDPSKARKEGDFYGAKNSS